MARSKQVGPRIRKAPLQPSESVADLAKRRPKLAVGRLAKPASSLAGVLAPLAPVFRTIKKGLGWLVPRYFVNAWRELRLVTWPSRRETWRLTGAVFIFAIIFGVLLTGVDKGLDDLFKKTVLK